MLSKEDNELLCRVGPGTPMGDLMRQYWMPAVRSDELPAPDCPPAARRACWARTSSPSASPPARSASCQNACPHRGASLFFGRNEEEGLRCVYHGWKFDVHRRLRRHADRAGREQLQEQGAGASPTPASSAAASSGPTWARARRRRRCPTSRPTCDPRARASATMLRECNWMQALEGDIDTVPRGLPAPGPPDAAKTPTQGTSCDYQRRATAPRATRSPTPSSASCYGAYRPAEDGHVLLAHRPLPVPVLRA